MSFLTDVEQYRDFGLIWWNLTIENFKQLLLKSNYYAKIQENLSRNAQDREPKQSGDRGTDTKHKELLAIRRIFSLVDMITNTKFSNCPNVFKIGVVWREGIT